MHSVKQLFTAVVATSFLAISLAPLTANAQATPAAACDPTYGSDVGTAFQTISPMLSGGSVPKLSDIGPATVGLAKARAALEDAATPAGCEATRAALIKLGGLDEDVLFFLIGQQADAKNAASYGTFKTSLWQPRFDAFKAILTGAATPSAMPPANTSGAKCTDTAFQTQVMTDLKGLSTPDPNDPAALGVFALTAIKLRYTYEDATAPVGCDAARQDFAQLVLAAEDAIIGQILKISDTTNAAAYTDFANNVANPRGGKIYTVLMTDLNAAPPAAATPAAQ